MGDQERRWEIVEADCIRYLASLPEDSQDAGVTDPPYLIGFMGKGFDTQDGLHVDPVRSYSWHLRWATEIFRVLKPGAHLLAFGGARTWHRLTCAVEDSGFEIRGSIDWIYSTGFPKSYNVAMGIDKASGAPDRAVKFTVAGGDLPSPRDGARGPWVPDSEEAEEWGGWGTALKPAHEPILIARKPLEGTITENVLKWGTGAMNIEACRVGTDSITSHGGRTNQLPGDARTGRQAGMFSARSPALEPSIHTGRWPPDVVLTHSLSCVPTGTKIVRNQGGNLTGDEPSSLDRSDLFNGFGARGEWTRYGGENGREVVENWACAPDCPVGILDRQSGVSRQTARILHDRTEPRGEGDFGFRGGNRAIPYEDQGGASRFFPTFSWQTEEVSLIYAPKASRSEREAGVLGDPTAKDGIMAAGGTPGWKCRKCGHWKVSGSPCVCAEPDFERVQFDRLPIRNTHPTVKPIGLCRWLIRLVTPNGGTVLDPFAGSGSIGCAAVIEGIRYLGIERESAYVKIANERIAYWQIIPPSQAPTSTLVETRKPAVTLDHFGGP